MNAQAGQHPSGDAQSVVIVLLAAGASRRYGSPKQLAEIDGEPMLRRVTRVALSTGAAVVVVLGAQADMVQSALEGMPVTIVRCSDWSAGMGRSLAAGAQTVQRDFPHASGLLLCLADQPLIATDMLNLLLRRHHDAPQKILASEHQQTLGPPVLFPRDCAAELAQWSGSKGAQALLQRESHRVERCLTEAGMDVDTPAALDHVKRLLAERRPPDRD